MSAEIAADETVILAAHSSAKVDTAGNRYVVHALTSEWVDPGQRDDCTAVRSSAYLARLE